MHIVGAGLISADIIQETGHDWKPLSRIAYGAGGTVGNILSHLSQAGCNTQILGAIGNDQMAALVRSDLETFGVDTSGLLAIDGTDTRRILHQIVVDGPLRGQHRFEMACPACRREFPPVQPPSFDALEPLMGGCFAPNTVLLIDRANALTVTLAERVSDAGGNVIFEPGYLSTRSSELVEAIMKRVDVLKFSHELTWNNRPFRKSIESLSTPRLQLVIETRGSLGVSFFRGRKEKSLVTQPVMDVRDSSGAGDAFMAGFLLGLGPLGISGIPAISDVLLERAIRRGQARGGLACLFLGSKGILYAHSHQEVESAVDHFVKFLRPPSMFGSKDLTGAVYPFNSLRTGECSVCRLSS